jgi:uncharacterized protein YbgA (DUF1722 family)/uncharacterized protein YbbK (DUF523 family)
MRDKPLVGISTCLLGESVRYNGGHQLDRYLRDTLGQYVDFLPVCPEVECGMDVPREAVRLVDIDGHIRLMTRKTEQDMTGQMTTWMRDKLKELADQPLCGFIFKSRSPSSGLYRIKVYKNNNVANNGTGIFAKGFTERFPLLPVEEDGRLNDKKLRENFIERIFIVHRWHQLNNRRRSVKALMDFHAGHKYVLMAHCPQTLKELGNFIANAKKTAIKTAYDTYFEKFITANAKIATVKKNTNVLLHIMGYFKKDLSPEEKQELKEIIDNYHRELVPLIVPITLLNHYVRKYQPEYLAQQVYLNPHPMELMLRNHV